MVKREGEFKVGDHVAWNSEAGQVRGIIIEKVTSDTNYKGYVHHASVKEPQYFIKSDKTDHVALHKGSALHLLGRDSGKTRNKGKKKPSGLTSRSGASEKV